MDHLSRLSSGVKDRVLAMHSNNKQVEDEEVLEEIAKSDCSQMVAAAVGHIPQKSDKLPPDVIF